MSVELLYDGCSEPVSGDGYLKGEAKGVAAKTRCFDLLLVVTMNLNATEELRHLLLGLRADDEPRGFGIAGYRVSCRRDSYDVLESLKEALAFILICHIGLEPAFDADEDGTHTHELQLLLQEHVTKQLSEWYRQKFDLRPNDTDANYVNGFGWGRDWRWWDARIRGDNDFLLLLDVSGWPCSGLTALRSLLEKCGAESMDEIPEEEW